MKISVVIPMYNASHEILNCLKGISQQEIKPYEIIVVDNNSSDNSVALVQDAKKDLDLVLSKESKQGPAAARNKGVELATGEIIAFIDSDCIPDRSWIKAIKEAFTEDKDLDAIGGIDKYSPYAASVMGKFLSAFWNNWNNRRPALMYRKEDFFDDKFIVTFNCAFKKVFLKEINGFDETFKTGEDVDISLRAVEAGGKILVWNNRTIVCHRLDISLADLIKKEFYYAQGLVKTVRRHFHGRISIRLPRRYYLWINKCGITMMLYLNAPRSIVLFVLLVISFCVIPQYVGFMISAMTLYSLGRIRNFFSKREIGITIKETALALFYLLVKELTQAFSRGYWSFKYGIILV